MKIVKANQTRMSQLLRILGIWAFLLLIWWALAAGQLSGFALIWSAAVAIFAHWLWPTLPYRLYWRHFLPLLGLFLRASVVGGLDVSRRAFQRKPQINSCFIDYPLQLPAGWARSVWVSVVGLFPGTLSVTDSGQDVRVHVLDDEMSVDQDLKQLEALLAAFIGLQLPSQESL
ncbi:Na+/H+ antiporter subunit E [Thiomicrospira sp. ALE5]|uniref:Na+/H+ antiporter subunit E n=1 Tax=Thiomicrospira sp. ALE5 TaxID=748650 RepID=UPI0008EF9515|nr:Na+/H+ antiporter subunit E [Thiomicrospira sp. ALE5]SFR53010.1 multicomponent Na+:H+ antiporter subunit E [Thiomicrospira sp. ALE5]